MADDKEHDINELAQAFPYEIRLRFGTREELQKVLRDIAPNEEGVADGVLQAAVFVHGDTTVDVFTWTDFPNNEMAVQAEALAEAMFGKAVN